ncbi:MAG: MATE family efflux transporter [Caldilineaceae bacterium]|nr:MATE family efflux transporter [Caldilineaceae bacterium]
MTSTPLVTAAESSRTEPVSWSKRKALLLEVWKLALPVILTNLLQSLVDTIDVFMVGRLGPIAIAAVGLSSAIRMLVLVMLLSVAAGAMTMIAQAKGARDPARMSFVTRQAISSGVLISLVLTVLGLLLARPLLSLVNSGGEPEAVALGLSYLRIIFLGTPFLVLNMVFNRLMQGAGDMVTPLILTGSLNVLNVLLNFVLMFGMGPIPAMGVAGAALGTVIARGTGVAVVFFLFYAGKHEVKILPGSYRPDWQLFKDIFEIGVPSGVQGLFRNGSRLLVLGIITSTEVGTYGAAALAIGFQVEALVFMPGLALNVAATSLVGQALGRWQPDEARLRGNMAIWLGLGVMAVLALPIIIFAPAIIRLFDPSSHPVLLATGTTYFRINTVVLPLSALAMVANGALRGAGDSVPGLISTMVTRALVAVSLAWVLAFPVGMGSLGVWIALAVGVVLEAIYMGWRWRGNAWLRVALGKTELYRTHLRHLPDSAQQRYLAEVRGPLMAQAGTREVVSESAVVYLQPEQEVRVSFGDGRWQLV